jgi:hypothetical protein
MSSHSTLQYLPATVGPGETDLLAISFLPIPINIDQPGRYARTPGKAFSVPKGTLFSFDEKKLL